MNKEEKQNNEISIIPEPVEISRNIGNFEITKETGLLVDNELESIGSYLQKLFSPAMGWECSIIENERDTQNLILLELNKAESNLGSEGYSLEVSKRGIEIRGDEPAGVFYGIQTLRQLLPSEIESKSTVQNINWLVPCVNIRDYPRFRWRGYMLDEARHFMGLAIVKRMLELMALHKLNKFHWHLVDDQGWRIEIKKYPKLTEIGSKRKLIRRRGEKANLDDPNLYGGFYTRDQIKEILTYAEERFIEVIPEIEMPGHSSAALAAYPELSCTGGPFKVPTRWGIFIDVYCPGKDNVYQFLEDVLDEIMELFPSKIIHIGGDEVPKIRWRACPDCRNKMKRENIPNVGKLHVHFTNHFAEYLESKGRRLMGWNEILDQNLASNAICQYWFRNEKEVINHIKQGREVVISKYLHLYLDHPYKLIPLRKAYKFDPILPKLDPKYHSNILGIEAPLWTERVPNLQRLDWQTFPRLTAYAETAWTPQPKKDFRSFKQRLTAFLKRLDIMDVSFAR